MSAHAACIYDTDPQIRELAAFVPRNATRALQDAKSLLQQLQHAKAPPERIAAVDAVLAQAYSDLELDREARATALAGLKLATDPRDPVHIALLTAHADSVYDSTGIAREVTAIESARAQQMRGSLGDVCLLISLGRLQYREDRADLAISSLTQAYQGSLDASRAEQHVIAAAVLASVMRMAGDFPQALALNQQVIDWDTAHGNTLDLSVTRYLRGQIENASHHFEAAIEEFARARALSVMVEDRVGIAFADRELCRNRIELGQAVAARAQCERAERSFARIGRNDELKDTQVLLARIDLIEGHPQSALATLDRVLEHGGLEMMPPRTQPSVYELRARTNAALHDWHAAYLDLDEYLRRYAAENEAQRVRQESTLRARFKTDQEIDRNASLQRELSLTRERSERQKTTLRWIVVAIVASSLVIVLLTSLLIANLRFRRQLVRLAGEDSLTGLPNRGRTAQLASAALAEANAAQQPLTIALIDMDRFKDVNDRCGHAAGDHVLKEFARLSREAIRSGDILGRWGGEEFLLVLPNATLDTAVASVERLRARAADSIQLPAPWQELRVSFSAGLAVSGDGVRTLDELTARADAALYQAKNDGRDRLRIADEDDRTLSSGTRRALRLGG